MKIAGSVLGMLILGLAALAVPAWLFEVRSERPLPQPRAEFAAAELGDGGGSERAGRTAAASLMAGLRSAMASARIAFEEHKRSEAVHAVDAALRAAHVAQHALEPQQSFAEVVDLLKQTRRVVQNGRPELATDKLDAAVAALEGIAPARAATQPPTDLARYANAMLIAVDGSHRGEVVGFRNGQALIASGARDVYGFIDWFSGETGSVPLDRLLFGKDKGVGATMVAVAGE